MLYRREIPRWLLASVLTAPFARVLGAAAPTRSAHGFATAAERRVGAKVADHRFQPGDVRRYGAVGDGVADDTRALADALAASHEAKCTMYLPAGRFRITSPLRKNQSFDCPNIRGEGYSLTSIVHKEIAADAALYIQGGSGRLCGSVIEGIGFDGSAASLGIEIDGQCGLAIRNCAFRNNAVGLRLNNKSSGAFTEYVVAESCHFDGSCAIALQYGVSGGKDSFNGSGLRYCTIVQASEGPAVDIGPGAIPYNAPLSMQAWVVGSRKVLIKNRAERPATFHGTITVETDGRLSSLALSPVVAAGSPVYLVGGISSLGYVNMGTLWTGTRAASLGPEAGSFNGLELFRKNAWSRRVALTPGKNLVANISDASGYLLFVELTAPDYESCHLLLATCRKIHGDSVRSISKLISIDDGQHGAPEFSIDSHGSFFIVNGGLPRTGAVAYVDFQPFGASRVNYGPAAVEYGNDTKHA